MSSHREEKVSLIVVISREALEKIGGQIKLAEQLSTSSGERVQVSVNSKPMGWGSVRGPMC